MEYEKAYKEALERARKLHGCPEYDAEIEEIFPELRESEDERIRNLIYCLIRDRSDNQKLLEHNGVSVDKALAYLEKQRTSKEALAYLKEHHSPSEVSDFQAAMDIAIAKAYDNGWKDALEKQKEQKPILEVFGFKVGDAVRLKDGDGRKHIIKSFEEVKGLHGPNFYRVEFEDNSAVGGIYPGKKYPNGYYTCMEKFEEEQKPVSGSSEKPNYHAEWSEEDEDYLADVKAAVYDYFDEGYAEELYTWLKSLPGRFNFQPKEEWSEEDEKMIEKLDGFLTEVFCYGHVYVSQKDKEELQNWLKSLRPQSHWKPSEEQMEALLWCTAHLGGADHRVLAELYEHLKMYCL